MLTESHDRQQALNRFLASCEKRAYRLAVIATGQTEEALDIVQDAMFKLVKRYAQRDEQEWPALFHRILQTTIRDWYRRQKVRLRWRQFFYSSADDEGDYGDPLENLAHPDHSGPDEQLRESHAMQQLDSALQALPLRQQQAFLLRQWEGLDIAQTAEAMGISQGSVKTHYSRAVHSLRDTLKDYR